MWWYSPGNTTVPLMKGRLLSPLTADFRVHLQRTSLSKSWAQESDKSTILVIERVSDGNSLIPRVRGDESYPSITRLADDDLEGFEKWTY